MPRTTQHTPNDTADIQLKQHPADTNTVTITLTGQPITDVWNELTTQTLPSITETIANITRNGPRRPEQNLTDELKTTTHPHPQTRVLATILSSLSPHGTTKQKTHAAHVLTNLGAQTLTANGLYTDTQHIETAAQLIRLDKPLEIKITNDFRDQRADQRRDICRLITALHEHNTLRITTGTLLKARWLAHQHTTNLPGSLIEQCNTTGDVTGNETQINAAIDRFDTDGGIIDLLRFINDSRTDTRSFEAMTSEFNVARDTIHNRLHHLREYNLVTETIHGDTTKHVTITATGQAYLEAVRESHGFQTELTDTETTRNSSLTANGKSSNNMPCNPASSREEGGWNRNRLPQQHSIRQLPRHRYHAVDAISGEADMTVVDANVSRLDDRAAPGIHYDHGERTLVVSAEYDNPMQYWVSIARALSSDRVWQWVFETPDLDSVEYEKFMTLFKEGKGVLRQLRCLGYTPDRITSIESYQKHITSGRDELLEDTKRLTKEEYPGELSRGEFRGEITADAHGLAGLMTHILELVNVDVVRELRVPRYREFDSSKRDGLVETLGYGAAIQSRYGEATSYRQLFEHRSLKREQAVIVDPDDDRLFSELIGSFVVVGDFKSQHSEFVQRLESGLTPGAPHDDAPEFNLRVSVQGGVSRRGYGEAVTRVLREKSLRPTRQAVSTLAGVCDSPVSAARAVNFLAANEDRRGIDSREVRYALSQLREGDVLRGAAATKQAVVMALLNVDEELQRSEVAAAAGVSERSLRTHLPGLCEVGLVSESGSGVRFELAFNSPGERTSDRYPAYVSSEGDPVVHKAAAALKTGVKHHFNGGVSDDAFPTWAGRRACRDLRGLQRPGVWLRDVLVLLWDVGCRDVYASGDGVLSEVTLETRGVCVGPELPQDRISSYQ